MTWEIILVICAVLAWSGWACAIAYRDWIKVKAPRRRPGRSAWWDN